MGNRHGYPFVLVVGWGLGENIKRARTGPSNQGAFVRDLVNYTGDAPFQSEPINAHRSIVPQKRLLIEQGGASIHLTDGRKTPTGLAKWTLESVSNQVVTNLAL